MSAFEASLVGVIVAMLVAFWPALYRVAVVFLLAYIAGMLR